MACRMFRVSMSFNSMQITIVVALSAFFPSKMGSTLSSKDGSIVNMIFTFFTLHAVESAVRYIV